MHVYADRASTLINSVPSYCGAQQDAALALHVYCTACDTANTTSHETLTRLSMGYRAKNILPPST
jgi:hypothetical protein